MGADLELESQTSALGRAAPPHCQHISHGSASPENTVKKAGCILLNIAKSKS